MSDIDDLIKAKLLDDVTSNGHQNKEPFLKENVDSFSTKLLELMQSFDDNNVFIKGQLVTWKLGLKNKQKPRIGEPAIVVKVLENPIFDTEQNSGSPYFKEPLDMIIGVFEEEHEAFILFHVDKRRFKPLS